MYIVETEDLTKRYNTIEAVGSLNLKVNEGEIFGYWGLMVLMPSNFYFSHPKDMKRLQGFYSAKSLIYAFPENVGRIAF